MKLGSSRGMDTKRPRGSESSKPCHQLRLTRRSQPPYPWPPEQAQPGVSKPCRTTKAMDTEPNGDVEKLYELACGYKPSQGGEGPGGNEQHVLKYLLTKGAPTGSQGQTTHKID